MEINNLEQLKKNIYQRILADSYEQIPPLYRLFNNKPVIKRTEFNRNLRSIDDIPTEMIFQLGNRNKILLLIFPLFLLLIMVYYIFILPNKIETDAAIGYFCLLTILIFAFLYNNNSESFKGKIIVSKKGILLYGYDLLTWPQILETYIKEVGIPRRENVYLVIALYNGQYVEQEIRLDFLSKYNKLSHYIEVYKRTAPNTA